MQFGSFVPPEVAEARREAQALLDEMTETTSRMLAAERLQREGLEARLRSAEADRAALAVELRRRDELLAAVSAQAETARSVAKRLVAARAELAGARAQLAGARSELDGERSLSQALKEKLDKAAATDSDAVVEAKLLRAYLHANMHKLHLQAQEANFEELCMRSIEWLTGYRAGNLDRFVQESRARYAELVLRA